MMCLEKSNQPPENAFRKEICKPINLQYVQKQNKYVELRKVFSFDLLFKSDSTKWDGPIVCS